MSRAARNTMIGGLVATLVSLLCIASPAQASGPGYYYAGAYQVLTGTDTTKGIGGNMWVANPYVQGNSNEHSLMEIAVADASGHAAEIGWVKDSSAAYPRLFASVWTGSGTWAGCYFEGCGWVDATPGSSADDLGRDLSSVASATFPGNVKSFSIQYSTAVACGASSGGWWFYYAGAGVGCYPDSVFTGSFTSANQGNAFGEVYYTGATVPCTDGGNGKDSSGTLGASGPAYFGSLSWVSPSPSTLAIDLTGTTVTVSAAYNVTLYTDVNGRHRTLGVGGPGYTSTGTTPGNTGSC